MTAIDLGTATTASWTPGVTGATVVLTVTLPDATTSTPTVSEVTGTYSATVATPQAGRYLLRWTKAAAPALAYTDLLDVWPSDPRFIISIDEMISGLQITGYTPSATDKSDMRLFIAAATPIIEDIVGAVLVRTVTQKASGGKSGVALHERASTITSVTVDSVAQVADSDYVFDANAGIVYAGSPQSPSMFNAGRMNITIVYPAGSATITPNVRLATVALVVHNWQNGRQATHGAVLPGDNPNVQMAQTPSGYWVPYRVIELCKPDVRVDGVG